MRLEHLAHIFSQPWPSTTKLVALAISDHINDDEGLCFASLETICTKCSLGRTAIVRSINELLACGYLSKQRRFSASSVYRVILSSRTPRDRSVVRQGTNDSSPRDQWIGRQGTTNHPLENHPLENTSRERSLSLPDGDRTADNMLKGEGRKAEQPIVHRASLKLPKRTPEEIASINKAFDALRKDMHL